MPSMYRLLKNIRLPRMAAVGCRFDDSRVEDIAAAIRFEMAKPGVGDSVRPGMKIAVGIGSRGLADLVLMAKTLVEELKKRGAEPFIVPAMGSHGGGTAEGQQEILASLGITEESVGCPIRATMETVPMGVVEIPELGQSCETFLDKNAFEADGICLIARVKPHPAFRDVIESGMCKMFVVGLGKQKGAQIYHRTANGRMGRVVENVARANLPKCHFLFTIGTVENAYEEICELKAVPRDAMIESDKDMLVRAKARLGRLPFEKMDVLISRQMGKDISGEGLDPNVTGRRSTGPFAGGPDVKRLGVLRLTDSSDGNVVGIGAYDAISEKLFKRIDFDISYSNAMTTGGLPNVKIPMVLKDDFEVLAACVHAAKVPDPTKTRMVMMLDTAHLAKIFCSEAMLPEIEADPRLTLLTDFEELRFNEEGDLLLDWE